MTAAFLRNTTAIVDGPLAFPTQTGWGNQFNGDNSRSPYQTQMIYSAANGNPFGPVRANGYLYAPHITPNFTSLVIQPGVGWNSTTDRNGPGRTGATANRVWLTHFGQGDAAAYNASVFVAGRREGATHFLANPAGSILNGGISAGMDGVYLNTIETIAVDNGFDVSSIGYVVNMVRNNDTGAFANVWNGIRVQSYGSRSIDSAFRIDGKADVVFDAVRGTGAALVARQGQRVYFQGSATSQQANTTLGETYVSHDGAGLTFVVGGVTVMRMSPTGIQTFVPVTP